MDQERILPLAEEVLSIAKAQLLVNLRFLDRALYELKPSPNALFTLATEGQHLFYQPYALLRAYRQEQGSAMRTWGHMLMHCLYRHMFTGSMQDNSLWDLACDMAAEAVLQELDLRQLRVLSGRAAREKTLEALSKKTKLLTAEKIYRYLLDHPPAESVLNEWKTLFQVDDHALWYMPAAEVAELMQGTEQNDGEGTPYADGMTADGLAAMWQDISQSIQTDLETFGQQQGYGAGNMLQTLRALNREKCDYRQFLRKFASRTEVMRLSPDEFDYVFYTYGMTLYKDMPLIEPLEYREDKRIRDFVIAIDTSGSVAGDQVQKFLQKTFTILKQEETFDRRFQLHIIQCDAMVQEDALITTQEEFDRYIKQMVIRGLGGTDFRPVFEYVEQLRKKKHFRNLRGMIYFTDGYGIFPAKQPDYLTAFIFVDDEARNVNVPPWAIKMVMETEMLTNEKE